MSLEPLRYLEQVAREFDRIDTRERIQTVLDELDFIYEALPPEFQDLCGGLIERLTARLAALPQ
jgi:predicted metallopeptidase